LSDGSIYWVGSRDDVVRPTGPFDPELPVLAFRDPSGGLVGLIFNHSTHTIGAITGNLRSSAFYGMAAQELESELGGLVCFLEGASGSTHRLDVSPADAFQRIKKAVLDALAQTERRPVEKLAAVKRPFTFKVRMFDEAAEEKAVSDYCTKRTGSRAESIAAVFRQMRKELAPHQGEARTTWLQAMVIGDVAIVGVPAEFFTQLGVDIKRRSPFEYTYVAELSNDWIGYVGDREAYDLGGYQLWMGLHSYCEPDTGERIVDQVVDMLNELAR
jgi:neutral ceramidase